MRFPNPIRAATFVLACVAATGSLADAAPADWRELPRKVPYGVEAPEAYRLMRVDLEAIRAELSSAPKLAAGLERGLEVQLPTPDGDFARFQVVEASVLSPKLQASKPHLRSYKGVGIDDPLARVRLGVLGDQFHADVRSPRGSWSVQERDGFDPGELVVAYKKDLPSTRFDCGTIEEVDVDAERYEARAAQPLAKALGEELVTYRLAITGTGEYTEFIGSVPQAEADLTLLASILNNIYENEFGVTFQVVDLNIYTDPATDPFPTGTVLNSTVLLQNNTALNAKLGFNGYDVGHLIGLTPGSGAYGLAFVGVQCSNSFQGAGGSFSGNPRAGNVADVAMHEVGHQLGASHSFNSESGGCTDNKSPSWAYEIGSGVTIMSYAGLCSPENVANAQIDIFNAGALQQISNRINGTPSCGTRTSSGNTAPVVSAGPAQTIPRSTAFEMRGSATDANDDPMSFAWEQYDLGPADSYVVQTSGPLFRNFEPSDDPTRSFPLYSSYRRGSVTPWEYLPGVDRTMFFRFIVRDNNLNAGSTVWASTSVQVSGDPFLVTAPNGGESFTAGTDVVVTWDAGGTVDANVRILLSDDAGITWTEAVASTPNDGSETVVLGCVPTAEGRVRVEGTENFWFDLSDTDFTVVPDDVPPVLTCPDPITVTATQPDGIPKDHPDLAPFFSGATAVDPCDPDPTIQDFAPPVIPVGVNTVAFTATDAEGNFAFCTADVTVEAVVAAPNQPGATRLVGVHPNPFNPRTSVVFELGREQSARLEVLDARGQRLRVLEDRRLPAGEHSASWDGNDDRGTQAASGVYFFRLVTEDGVQVRRAALLK